MRRRVALFVASVIVAVPTLEMLTTSQAGATFEFSFTTHETNLEFKIDGHSTLTPTGPFAPGDQIIVRDSILRGGTLVGYDNIVCDVTFNNNVLCNAVFAFNGIGDLMGQALIRNEVSNNPPAVFDGAITGGTFAYRNAHGDAHIVVTSATDANYTVNFVTQ